MRLRIAAVWMSSCLSVLIWAVSSRRTGFRFSSRNSISNARRFVLLLHFHSSVAALVLPSTTKTKCARESGTTGNSIARSMTKSVQENSGVCSNSNCNDENDADCQERRTLRILALHGSEGSAASISETLSFWNKNLRDTASSLLSSSSRDASCNDDDKSSKTTFQLDVTAITAPVPKGNGFAWWAMPPGIRSFTATEYEGFETSCNMVLEQLFSTPNQPFDLIMGHSQGAILITAMLALDKIPMSQHPTCGYILNGVAWPNPYTKQLESLTIAQSDDEKSPSPALALPPPNVLLIVGEKDRMNPPEQAARVQSALEAAGFSLSVVRHPGGHSVPIIDQENERTISSILNWIASNADGTLQTRTKASKL